MIGCSSSTDAPVGAPADVDNVEQPGCFGLCKPPHVDTITPLGPGPDSEHAGQRADCYYGRGDRSRVTFGHDVVKFHKILDDNPIEKVVVVMQENRSFDHYFGMLNDYRHERLKAAGDENGLKPIPAWSEDNPMWADVPTRDADGKYPWNPINVGIENPTEYEKFYWEHAPRLCSSDTNHQWWGSHLQHNGGKMNGFVQASHNFFSKGEPTIPKEREAVDLHGRRAMWYYDHTDLPFYYELANTFSIADRYFSSVMGPTYINRDYLYAGTSFGLTYCGLPKLKKEKKPIVITDLLKKAGKTWAIYIDGDHIVEMFAPRIATVLGRNPLELVKRGMVHQNHVYTFSRFLHDAETGSLPDVSFIDADIREDADGNDEHAPADVQRGQAFVHKIVKAMMTSPDWEKSVTFITYDEHGGSYDHVVPPAACIPDHHSKPENLKYDDETTSGKTDRLFSGGFEQLGFRVPMMAISAWSKPGHVSHVIYDHTSITRFIEWMYDMPALTKRDANAMPPFDMFDFTRLSFPSSRVRELFPEAPFVDPVKAQECKDLYPPAGIHAQRIIPSRIAADPYEEDSAPNIQGCGFPALKASMPQEVASAAPVTPPTPVASAAPAAPATPPVTTRTITREDGTVVHVTDI